MQLLLYTCSMPRAMPTNGHKEKHKLVDLVTAVPTTARVTDMTTAALPVACLSRHCLGAVRRRYAMSCSYTQGSRCDTTEI